MGGIPLPFAQTALALDPAPVPILATWSNDIFGITITFDKPLRPQLLQPGNWSLRCAGRVRTMTNPHVVPPDKVVSRTVPIGGPVLGNRVSYSAAVPDLVGLNGRPVERFLGFPVDVF